MLRSATSIAPLVALLVLLTQGTASAFTTTIVPGTASEIFAQARADQSVSLVTDSVVFTTIPANENLLAESSGGGFDATATATILLTNPAFDIDLSLAQTGNLESSARVNGAIAFSVDEAVPYNLSGALAVLDTETSGEIAKLFVRLATTDLQTVLFSQLQETDGVIDPLFELGVDAGYGAPVGSLTGMLLANTDYLLSIDALVMDSSTPTESSYATGQINLNLVPEPSTALLLGFGLMALARGKRRR